MELEINTHSSFIVAVCEPGCEVRAHRFVVLVQTICLDPVLEGTTISFYMPI